MVCDHKKDTFTKTQKYDIWSYNLGVEKKTTETLTKENSTQKTYKEETMERRGKQETIHKEDLLASN